MTGQVASVVLLLWFIVLIGGGPVSAWAMERIKIAIPSPSTTFAPLFQARAAGYFAEEGLDVDIAVVPGAGAVQAVIARDAQFFIAPGTYQLMLYERGQRLLSVMRS
jgi:ABC-type nitrate/sulfonate/bicarbonate transport system substrate-binding protein